MKEKKIIEKTLKGDNLSKEDLINKLKNTTSLVDFYSFKEKILKELGGN